MTTTLDDKRKEDDVHKNRLNQFLFALALAGLSACAQPYAGDDADTYAAGDAEDEVESGAEDDAEAEVVEPTFSEASPPPPDDSKLRLYIPPVAVNSFKAMSLNVRNPADPGQHSWGNRRPRLSSLIADKAPHVVGVQELNPGKLDALTSDLRGSWQWVWVHSPSHPVASRDGNSLAIFLRSDRFELLDHGFKGIENSDRDALCGVRDDEDPQWRAILFAHLRDKTTNKRFYVYNTHFPSKHSCERKQMAKIARDFIADRAQNDPVVFVGDFNDGVNADGSYNDSYRRVIEYNGLRNAYGDVHSFDSSSAFATAHEYDSAHRVGRMIDHILVAPAFGVSSADVDHTVFKTDGTLVRCETLRNDVCTDGTPRNQTWNYSDHWSVWAWLRL